MRFYCRNCQKSIEEERIDQARLKEYKSGKMPLMAVVCPDCGCGTLEGGGSMMVVCPYCCSDRTVTKVSRVRSAAHHGRTV